jgi:hypothetical protein
MTPETDEQIALDFIQLLQKKGFTIERRDYSGHLEDDPYFNPECGISYEFKGIGGDTVFSIDFLDGSFYRISGWTQQGWFDEVDGVKYE